MKRNENLILDLSNIPLKSQKKVIYDWKNSVDKTVDYEYNGTKGQFRIMEYHYNADTRRNTLYIYDTTRKQHYNLDSRNFKDSRFELKE